MLLLYLLPKPLHSIIKPKFPLTENFRFHPKLLIYFRAPIRSTLYEEYSQESSCLYCCGTLYVDTKVTPPCLSTVTSHVSNCRRRERSGFVSTHQGGWLF